MKLYFLVSMNSRDVLNLAWIVGDMLYQRRVEEKTDIASGLYFISPDGRGGHPLIVC